MVVFAKILVPNLRGSYGAESCSRHSFLELLDSVVDFAYARLELNLRIGCDRAHRDPEKQSEVMRALCAHPEVLQEYDLNPPPNSPAYIAALWQTCRSKNATHA